MNEPATGIAPALGKHLVDMDFYLHGYNNISYSSSLPVRALGT